MQTLYDTRRVHPFDRYDYYQAAAATEFAPVSAHGRAPGRLLVAMSAAKVDEIELEHVTWSTDSVLVTRRTEPIIRASDRACYRIFLNTSGVTFGEQAGNRIALGLHDMTMFDLSQPYACTHRPGHDLARTVMLSIPRALVPVSGATVQPLLGTLVPRRLPGRSLIAQFLVGLIQPDRPILDPDLAEVLRESAIGLIRMWAGQSSGISPHTRRTLWMAHLRNVIRQRLDDPTLSVDQLARAANISARCLHALFHDSGHTPMQLVKQLRLQECHRSLQDPALHATPIKDIIAAHGYLRPDQFARDFRRQFGISATQVRALAAG